VSEDRASDPWAGWRGRLAASRKRKDDRVTGWQQNVRKRIGDERTTSAESTGSLAPNPPVPSINKDWPLTKAKIALLYSQTPEIRLSTTDPNAGPIVQQFAAKLNEEIRKANIGARIEEELADVINASGISAVVLACEKRTEMRDMPSVDPMIAGMTGQVPEMIPVDTVVDIRYPSRRISPASLLVPADFTGSVYDDARWLAYDDNLPWATAKSEFKLSDDVKEKVCGTDKRVNTSNSLNTDVDKFRDNEVVNFTEVFYWRHYYHEEETSYAALQRVVFVEGLDEPVIDEPYAGQKRTEDGTIVGITRNPIQVLALTYISDDCLPPSDSTISRPQVNELEKSRHDFALQRKHAIPQRMFNPSLVSPNARAALERGTYQGAFAVSGQFERAIGIVPQANLPQERYELDSIINQEITDEWTVGPNQGGSFASGERSAREAGIVEQNFKTRIGQERAKVERHFVACAEILGALMALHGNAGIPVELLGSITYSIRVDSTVLLDSQQRIEQIKEFVNMWGQSGVANIKALAVEHAELLGFDPAKVTIDPQPKPPEPVKISIGSAEDIVNPLMLAAMAATNQLPAPEHVAAVAKLLQALESIPGMTEMLIPKEPVDPNQQPSDVERPGIHNADWQEQPRLNKRDQDGGA